MFSHQKKMHAKSCFEYELECRYNLPTLAKTKSCVNVHEGAKVWYDVMGERRTHHPITIDLKREARSGRYFTVPPILLNTLKRMTKNHFSV
eukprot:scaffold36233_cov58-Attheya_sp.AAC.2